MANRTRKNSIQFYVTDDELALISERMKEEGVSSRGEYMRRMAIDGLTVNVDCGSIKALCEEVSVIGRNINQIARFVNGSGNVYRHDIDEIKRCLADIWRMLRRFLSVTT